MAGKILLNRHMASPNCDAGPIDVQFLVIHYSAASLEETLRICKDPQRKVSAHLVIGPEGETFEVVKCWDGIAGRAWHAGESRIETPQGASCGFNDFSIGIELANFNGNLLPYTTRQYEVLCAVISHLQTHYPALKEAGSVVGHEHIAGFRGKIDPGWCFDWERIFRSCFPGQIVPERKPVLEPEIKSALEKLVALFSVQETTSDRLWSALNSLLEKTLGRKISQDT